MGEPTTSPRHTPEARLEVRQQLSVPLVEDLEPWLLGERALLSKHAKVAKAIDYHKRSQLAKVRLGQWP